MGVNTSVSAPRRVVTWLLLFVFFFEQTGFSSDSLFERAQYSVVKSLLPGPKDREQARNFSPSYLLKAQAKHEDVIRGKNLIEREMFYVIVRPPRAAEASAPLLKKRKGDSALMNRRTEYTLSDYDAANRPQQISVYSYDTSTGALKSVVSYDIRKKDNTWARSDLENIAEPEDPKVMASFEKGDYTRLVDELKVTETVYFGDQGEEKIDHVLSGFRDGKATEAAIYIYDPSGTVLKEVKTYDVRSLASAFSKDDWKSYISVNSRAFKNDAMENGKLEKRSVYEGGAGNEKVVYTLSEYSAGEVPGRIDCFDYSGGGASGALSTVRAYNIKGMDLEGHLEGLRSGLGTYDNILDSKSFYKGREDRERIDHALSSYYPDGGGYKPSLRTDYVYDGGNGRLARTETYCVKGGAKVLRQCSEFEGLRGYENVSRSYDYEIDGITLYSVSVYCYDLEENPGLPHIGGDGNEYTLDRVTRYVGAADPHDLSAAIVKSETYYDGFEGEENASYSYSFDIRNGDIAARTEYSYEDEALRETRTYRLLDPAIAYGSGSGNKVSSAAYFGEEGQEKIRLILNFDLLGTLITSMDHKYASDGRLIETVSSDSEGRGISRTTYDGPERYEKRSVSTEYDLLGNAVTTIEYEYSIVDSLEKAVSRDAEGARISEITYRGVPGEEKISGTAVFDRSGRETGTTEYRYESGCVLSGTVTRDESGRELSAALYDGPEGFERIVSSENHDLSGEKLTDTFYSYSDSGALVSTVTENADGVRISEALYAGLMGRENLDSVSSFDLAGEKISETVYHYADNGAMDRAETSGYAGDDRSVLVKLSETFYEGAMGREKISILRAFDLEGGALSEAEYNYGADGALAGTATWCYTDDERTAAGRKKLSENAYEGVLGRERVLRVTSFDLTELAVNETSYVYAASGALERTETWGYTDEARTVKKILSSGVYEGRMDRERVTRAISYDLEGETLAETIYEYRDNGAIERTETFGFGDAEGDVPRKLSESGYEGLMGHERISGSASMDLSGGILNRTVYFYRASGAVKKTEVWGVISEEGADPVWKKTSESLYQGLKGREHVLSTDNYDLGGDLLTSASYEYREDGSLFRMTTSAFMEGGPLRVSVTLYGGLMDRESITGAKSYDQAGNLTAITDYVYDDDGALRGTFTKDEKNNLLTETSYAGRMGRESVSCARNFDLEGALLSTSVYEYMPDGSIMSVLNYGPAGERLSESVYEGRMNRERVLSVTNYDLAGGVLSVTSYTYNAAGAIDRTVTSDDAGNKLSESVHEGRMNRERVFSVTNYDFAEGVLSTTSYIYNAAGAIDRTVTTDDAGNKLSESTYEGRMNRERVLSVTSYDLAGDALLITLYTYNAAGAIERTITTDDAGNKFSESVYEGRMNREHVLNVTSYDLAGGALSVTSYAYNADGAIASTVTSDEAGNKLSESVYEGRMNRERVLSVISYDLAGNVLSVTSYAYNADGAIDSTVTSDDAGNKRSESVYEGRMNRERVLSVINYDLTGDLLSITLYTYNAAGAIERTITTDDAGNKFSESTYEGNMNRERVLSVTSYDLAGDALLLTSYIYNADGAIASTVTSDEAGNELSESVYEGRMNRERVSNVTSYDLAGDVLSVTSYAYNAAGAISSTVTSDDAGNKRSESVYEGRMNRERVLSVINYDLTGDLLSITLYTYNAAGAIERTVTTDDAGNKFSESTYEGNMNRERVLSVTSYDLAGDALLLTSYTYNADGAIDSTVTSDEAGNELSESVYEGRMNRERVLSVINYDLAGDVLSVTFYAYNADGAIDSTATSDEAGNELSESAYEGRMNREHVLSVTSYDLAGDVLSIISYTYNAGGAIASTVTSDDAGNKFSESTYEGNMNRERVLSVTSYDLAGDALLLTSYTYNADGAIASTVTSDDAGNKLSESAYEGNMNRERVLSVTSYDLAGDALSITSYAYNADGAVDRTVTTDDAGNKLSESTYEGRMNREHVLNVTSYDLAGDVLSITSYTYNADGAIGSTITSDETGNKLSESTYEGNMNRERVLTAISYDLAGNALSVTSYAYNADGAIDRTVTTDDAGSKLSESTYEGRMNRERAVITKSFDPAGMLLANTEYVYGLDGAVAKTIMMDEKDNLLSESAYTGRVGREKICSVKNYDLSPELLSTTTYKYEGSGGALSSTVTYDSAENMLSRAEYQGWSGRERTSLVTSYDEAGGELTRIIYVYAANGAIQRVESWGFTDSGRGTSYKMSESVYEGLMGRERVVTASAFDFDGGFLNETVYSYGADGAMAGSEVWVYTDETRSVKKKLSESVYEGRVGRERANGSRSYDLEGTLLNTTEYQYDPSGALFKLITRSYHSEGYVLSETAYSGPKDREKASLAVSYDLAGNVTSSTAYVYEASTGALKSTVTRDGLGNKVSENRYSGLMNREKQERALSFRDDGIEADTLTVYLYSSLTGAMSEAVTFKAAAGADGSVSEGRKLSSALYSGLSGREKTCKAVNYDPSGGETSFVTYVYGADGALLMTASRRADDAASPVASETYYSGLDGYEVADLVLNYSEDDAHAVKSTSFYFYESFRLYAAGEAVYAIGRAGEAFRDDPLRRVETYEGGDGSGSPDGLPLESIAYYRGSKGREVVDFSQKWDLRPGSDTERYLKSTTVYGYNDERALRVAYTYKEGIKGSKDVEGSRRDSLAKYEGDRGEETICYMEGSVCSYELDDHDEWDYFVRTDFTYDEKKRNTGYFEEIYTPDGKWDWTEPERGEFVDAREVKFSGFDEKDRYLKVEKTVFEKDPGGVYVPTGESSVQEGFIYDGMDNVTYYRETQTDKEGKVRRYELTLEDFIKDRAAQITTWELDESYERNGDFSRKSSIVYYSWGQIASYTLTSSTDNKERVSNVFDIRYNKDLVIEDKMTSPGDIIYFDGERDYTLREYRYSKRKELETTTSSSGDSVSVSDKDGRLIYFEWTEEMAPFREKDYVSPAEPEGAGQRAGSMTPSNPVLDMLEEIRECAASEEVIAGRDTVIEYGENGQARRITDIKGNEYTYENNRLTELKDGSGNIVAVVTYDETNEVLTASMNSLTDAASAVFRYDADRRKISVDVTDGAGAAVLSETYSYVYGPGAGRKVASVTVARRFLEAGDITVADRIENYDEEERLVEIYTHSKCEGPGSFVSYWQAEAFSADDKLTACREIRLDSSLFDFERYTSADGITTDDDIFDHIMSFKGTGDPGLSDEDRLVYGVNDVLVSDETWSAVYNADGNIDETAKEKETFKYAPVTNAVAWEGTGHAYEGGHTPAYGIDGDPDTSHWASCGRSSGVYIVSTHIFDAPKYISEIYYKVYGAAGAWGYDEYGAHWGNYFNFYIKKSGGGWEEIPGSATSGSAEGSIAINMAGIEGIKVCASAYNSINGGKGDGYAAVNIYEVQASCPDTNIYTDALVRLSDVTAVFDAKGYDAKKNILEYAETRTENISHLNMSGTACPEKTLVSETFWKAGYDDGGVWKGGYTADRTDSFTQTVHKTYPDGTLNVTESTVRSGIEYEKGNITGYYERYNTTAELAKTVERTVFGMTYENGRLVEFTETVHQTGPGLDSTTVNTRTDMVYDARGNLLSWTDIFTNDVSQYSVTPALRALWEDASTGLKAVFPDIAGTGTGDWAGKTIINWAIAEGYKSYDGIRDYGPSRKTTVVDAFDDSGRMLEYAEVETYFKDISAGSPRQEQQKTTERLRTVYSAPDRIKSLTEKIRVIKCSDGSVLEEKTVTTNNITYTSLGQQYSYSSTVNGETSRVDSSEYNVLGQLARQYTRIDAYSFSETFYYYDAAGQISRTVNHYFYEKQTTEQSGKDTVTITEHYEKTTTYDKYGEKTAESVNEYTHVDVKKSFWTDTFGQFLLRAVGIVLSCIPTVGWALSLAYNNIVAVIQGTFSWMSFAVQMACTFVKFAFKGIAENLGLISRPDPEALRTIAEANVLNMGHGFEMNTFMKVFSENLAVAAVTNAVSEGITAVGRAGGWNSFLTSAVANFASTAVGYGMNGFGGADPAFSMTSAAAEAFAIAAIDKYAEDHPSDWANILAPIARAAIGEAFGLSRLANAKIRRDELAARVMEAAAFGVFGEREGSGSYPGAASGTFREKVVLDAMDKAVSQSALKEYDEGKIAFGDLVKDAVNAGLSVDKVYADIESDVLKKILNIPVQLPGAGDANRKYESLAGKPDLIFRGVVSAADLREEAAEIAELSGAEKVTALFDPRTGIEYYRFALIKDVGPILQTVASGFALDTYEKNLDLGRNATLEMLVSADGKEAYILGNAAFKELKGAAKNWAMLAGYSGGDTVEFEFNLKSGDLFLFLDVRDAGNFFAPENVADNAELSTLKQVLVEGVGGIEGIKTLELAVRINGQDAKTGEIVKASFTIDPADITNKALAERVEAYLNGNFGALRSGCFNVLLSVEPHKGGEVRVEGITLDLSQNGLRDAIDSLKEQTPQLRKLAGEIDRLVKLADNEPRNFERVTVTVNEKGEYAINVKIRTENLKNLPGVLSKLGVMDLTQLGRGEFSSFIVDVKTGCYSLDLSLKCGGLESLMRRVGETKITALDAKGRVLKSEVYDRAGSLVVKKEFSYADTSPELFEGAESAGNGILLTETFFVGFEDGRTAELHRISLGFMESGSFRADGSAFEDLSGFEGGKFSYIVGDLVMEFAVKMPRAGGEGLAIMGVLPAAQMGLKADFGWLEKGSPVEKANAYEAYTIGVELKGTTLTINDDKLLTVNGSDRAGAIFSRGFGDGPASVMFVYNGAELSVEGSGIAIMSGEALFFTEDMIVAPEIPQVPVGDALSPLAAESEAAVLGDNPLSVLQRLDNILCPIAGASGLIGRVDVGDNMFITGDDGSIIPVVGIFRIRDNEAVDPNVDISALESVPRSAFEERVYAKEKVLVEALADTHEKLKGNMMASKVLQGVSGAIPGIGNADITTREGLYQAVFAIALTSGVFVGGSQSIAGLVELVPLIYRAAQGLLTRDESTFLQKSLGMTEKVWRTFKIYISDVMERAMTAWYTRDGVEMVREAGHLIGEFIGSALVFEGAGKCCKQVFTKTWGKINGALGKTVEVVGETGLTSSNKGVQVFSGGYRQTLPGGMGEEFKAFKTRTGWFDESFGPVSKRGVGESVDAGGKEALKGVSAGSDGFGKAIHRGGATASAGREAASAGREAASAGREAASAGREAASAASKSTITTGGRLFTLAKAIGKVAKELINTYISEQGARASSGLIEGKGPLVGGARGAYKAWEGTWDRTGFRQAWLAYGVAGGVLWALPEAIKGDSISYLKDFFAPDLDDPTSFGAAFWTGVYEDVSAGYEAVKGTWGELTSAFPAGGLSGDMSKGFNMGSALGNLAASGVNEFGQSVGEPIANRLLNPGKAGFELGTELGKEAAPDVYGTMKEVIKSAAIGAEKNLNRIAGLGPYTAEDFAIDRAWALETARSVDLDGAIVFAVGRGPVQSITRFGELSGFGESKRDIFNFLSNPSFAIGEYGTKYLWNAFTNKDMVPHHVGMARIVDKTGSDGMVKNYIMQINPEGETKVPVETFASGNLTIKIIMPESGATSSAEIWGANFDPITHKSTSGRTYDFLRLIGWGDDSKRGTEKAICSEDVYFARAGWAENASREDKKYVYPLPGVIFDNRVTPWDMYKPRDLWDKDMVREFVKQNLQRAEEIAQRVRANIK